MSFCRILFLSAIFVSTAFAETVQTGCQYSDGGIVRGPTDQKKIALVFTGDAFAEGGETILNGLAKHHAKASFFLSGNFLTNANFAPLVRRIIADGNYVGPHSDKHLLFCDWNHPAKTLVTRAEFRADIAANLAKIESFGVKQSAIRFFLPAFEHFNPDIAAWSAEMGLTLIDFTPGTRSNADYTGEADKNFVPSQRIFDSIVERERDDPRGMNGFILLLHIGSGPGRTDKFSNRFGGLLDLLSSKGYQFVRVDELLKPQSEIFVRANQIGYNLNEPKIALAFSDSDLPKTFSIVDAATQKSIFNSTTKFINNATWGQFTNHAKLDFSSLTNPGTYFVRCGGADSLPFEIGRNEYAKLPDELLEFMREQRCGYNPWFHTNCHQLDGRTAYGPLPYGTHLDVRGGWHDAGDTLKYLMTCENATAQMLLAYKLNQEDSLGADFADRVDVLGNPGSNGIPDILDEAHWGLEWMLKLHPAPDQLYFQVGDDRDHIGWRLPQNDQADYGWGKGGARVVYFANGKPQGLGKYKSASTGIANLAGTYAAAMALAYQIWKDDPQQKAFAQRCLKAGLEVYALGRAKPGVQQGNSFSAPYRYASTIWACDMEWGAAELFRATGEQKFLNDAKRYARLAAEQSWMGKEQTGHYQFFPFVNVGHFRLYGLVDDHFKKILAGYYRNGIERCVRAGKKNSYRVGVPFIWCSDNLVVALVTQCNLYERMTGDTRYHEFAAKQLDWLLGRNPWGTTMFTEIGGVFPTDVHLATVQVLHRPVRGALVDGPVYDRIFKSLKGVSIAEPDPLAAFQGSAVYHNDGHDYSSNEPTMDGTASAILMFVLETSAAKN
jgi:endoglucanase